VRPLLPAFTARLASAIRRRPVAGSRLATGTLTALAALAPTMLLAMGVAIPGAGPGGGRAAGRRSVVTAPTPGPSATPAPTSKPSAGQLYRIVGCRSRGSLAYRHGPSRREVAIGFDDGPWSDTTAFVRMLERSHARATFFMIGRQLGGRYRAMLMRELRDGDVLGDHTFTHPDLTRSGDAYTQLHETLAAIRSLSGYTPCVFRPPYGTYNDAVVNVARSLGLATVLWNVDPADYTQPGTGAIEQRVLAQVQPGSILISHDGGGTRSQTLNAYPSIIAALRKRGYRIVTIPELLGFRPVYVPCIRLCDGIGVPRGKLPRNAILRRAP
jgi:peptidoglycan/xylan/chitin deacetylase (PgdA/CDA1 family)